MLGEHALSAVTLCEDPLGKSPGIIIDLDDHSLGGLGSQFILDVGVESISLRGRQ